ncbi:MAG: thermonuclease family protein [Candidatus Paceibacterota bacterium]|jgi:micrococcal nuclease
MASHDVMPKMVNRLSILGIIILILACLYQLFAWGIFKISTPSDKDSLNYAATNTEVEINSVGTFYKVERVIDGDTFIVNVHGTNEKVRLIGVNTPETADPYNPIQCFGEEATNRLKELILNKLIQLKYDYTQNTHDIYNRLLVYAYLEDGEMVNRKLIAEGYAYEYTYMTPYMYQSEFRELQNIARASHRGLWSKDTCDGNKYFTP